MSIDDFTYSIKNPFNNKTYIGNKKIKNREGIGQFINDGFNFELLDDYRDIQYGCFKISSDKINVAIKNYVDMSTKKSNCGFLKSKKNLIKIYAHRNIEQNEELYLHYGVDYWISKIQLETDEPLTRLFCYMINCNLTINNNNIYLDDKIIIPTQMFQLLRISSNGNLINALNIDDLSDLNKIIKLIELVK